MSTLHQSKELWQLKKWHISYWEELLPITECQKQSLQTKTSYLHWSFGQCLWNLWVLIIDWQQHITHKEMVRLNKWTKWLSNIYSIISIINKTIGLITYLQHSLHLTTQSTQLYKRHHSLQITDTTHSFVVNCSIKTDLFQKTQKTKLTKWENYTHNSCKILILWIYKAQFITTNTKKRDQLLKGGRKHFYSAEISKQSNQAKNSIIRRSDHSQLKKKSDKWIIISSYQNLWNEFIQYSTYHYSNLHQRMPKHRRTSKLKAKTNTKLKRSSTTNKLADDHIILWSGKVTTPQKTPGNLLHT